MKHFASLSLGLAFSLAVFASISACAQGTNGAAYYQPPQPSTDTVILTWDWAGQAGDDPEFVIYVGTESGKYTAIEPVAAGLRTKTITGLNPAIGSYYFVITAKLGGLESLPSAEISLKQVDSEDSGHPMPPGFTAARRIKTIASSSTTVTTVTNTMTVELLGVPR